MPRRWEPALQVGDSMREAEELVAKLRQNDLRVVFAESCTAGLISASLGLVPGVSGYLCGSAVVYREQTKMSWLEVDPETLAEHSAESLETTEQITVGVLKKTPEADLALGITGHFGPNAPEELDGRIFVVACARNKHDATRLLGRQCIRLRAKSRPNRQRESVTVALRFLIELIS